MRLNVRNYLINTTTVFVFLLCSALAGYFFFGHQLTVSWQTLLIGVLLSLLLGLIATWLEAHGWW